MADPLTSVWPEPYYLTGPFGQTESVTNACCRPTAVCRASAYLSRSSHCHATSVTCVLATHERQQVEVCETCIVSRYGARFLSRTFLLAGMPNQACDVRTGGAFVWRLMDWDRERYPAREISRSLIRAAHVARAKALEQLAAREHCYSTILADLSELLRMSPPRWQRRS